MKIPQKRTLSSRVRSHIAIYWLPFLCSERLGGSECEKACQQPGVYGSKSISSHSPPPQWLRRSLKDGSGSPLCHPRRESKPWDRAGTAASCPGPQDRWQDTSEAFKGRESQQTGLMCLERHTWDMERAGGDEYPPTAPFSGFLSSPGHSCHPHSDTEMHSLCPLVPRASPAGKHHLCTFLPQNQPSVHSNCKVWHKRCHQGTASALKFTWWHYGQAVPVSGNAGDQKTTGIILTHNTYRCRQPLHLNPLANPQAPHRQFW